MGGSGDSETDHGGRGQARPTAPAPSRRGLWVLALLAVCVLVAWCGPRSDPRRFAAPAPDRSRSVPCACGSNLYNCPDFPTSRAAQDCYLHCIDQGVGDVHRLDRDSDGRACEWNPGGY